MPRATGDQVGMYTMRMGSTIFCKMMGVVIQTQWDNVYGSKDVQK